MPKDHSAAYPMYERPSSFVSLLSGWVQQGLESFFATQRIIVDLVMRQNNNAMKSIREGLSESEEKDSPMKVITELAVEGTSNYIEAQRILLDLAQQENEIVMNGVKDRVGGLGAAVAMTNIIRRSINTFVEMQQNFLVLASKRTQGWLQDSEEGGKGVDGVVGFAGEAMEEFIAAQKKFLDVISEETSGSVDGKKEHAGRKPSKEEVATLAREAADAFIEAQKKLLDVAGQQVHVNVQAASRVFDMKMPLRILPVADIAGESVKSFVDAEKALVDSMMKTRSQTKHRAAVKVAVKKRAAAKRTATKRVARRRAKKVEEEVEV